MTQRASVAPKSTARSSDATNGMPDVVLHSEVNLVTASWFTPLPLGLVRVGISRGMPRGMPAGYRMYRKLAPGPWFKSVDESEYQRRYFKEVLGQLDPVAVIAELQALTDGAPAALCCFERANDDHFCHRAFVSAWLHEELGLSVREFERGGDGHGWRHPKLPAGL